MNTTIDAFNNQSGIYQIRNLSNGKIYLGSTKSFRKRFREHRHNLLKNTHYNIYLQRSFNKHGSEKFVFEILEIVQSVDDLINVEQTYLDNLNCCDKNVGYNICEIANRYSVYGEDHHSYGIPLKESHKEKISNALMGHEHTAETRKKISAGLQGKNFGKDHWSYGKERSDEHRMKQSLSMKGKLVGDKNPFYGKKHTMETKRAKGIPVVQLTKTGEFLARHETLTEAAEFNDMSKSHIGSCCKGKRKTAGGFKWVYLEEYEVMKAL